MERDLLEVKWHGEIRVQTSTPDGLLRLEKPSIALRIAFAPAPRRARVEHRQRVASATERDLRLTGGGPFCA